MFCLSLFVLRAYARAYDPAFGWTRMIAFGSAFTDHTLPRLQRTAHYVNPRPGARMGYDGQFYAQLALDPSLLDPAFDNALDLPAYRARRIGLPALAFAAGLGKPRWILQVYALSNLFFWFVLSGTFVWLRKPRTVPALLCLCAVLLGNGVLASMERSLIDLPAAALILAGQLVGSWGGCALLAGALLTRETSLLAAPGFLDFRRPRDAAAWKKGLVMLAVVVVPLAAWLVDVRLRFGASQDAVTPYNFSLPLEAMTAHFVDKLEFCFRDGFGAFARRSGPFGWWYRDDALNEALTILSLCGQGLYLGLRRDFGCAFWRIGVCYVALGCVLGGAVWVEASAAARVLLPMTICFYLRLARERPGWFWPFFLVGSLAIPYRVHEFWTRF